MASRRSITKHDVALADVQRKANRERLAISALAIVFVVGMSTFPIIALSDLVKPFAGKETVVNVNLVVGVTLALSIVINIGQIAKGRYRHKTIISQRARLNQLEGAEA
jgi:hypothetical protein